MNVYVETNFVLELAFMQEQHQSCDGIASLCEGSAARLVLPAFCIAECYETLVRRTNKRKQIADELDRELGELSRSKPYQHEIDAIPSVAGLLTRSSQDEDERLIAVLDRLLKIADIIPLEAGIVLAATQCRDQYKLKPQDSIVFSSVSQHLGRSASVESCFINRNSRDFNDADIEESLAKLGCKLLFSFDVGRDYIGHRLGTDPIT